MTAPAAEEGVVNLSSLIGPQGPHPRQIEFLKACDKYAFLLYGGARGGGKSHILRWAVIRFLFQLTAQGFKNVRAGIFCNTYRELRIRQWEFSKLEFPQWLGAFSETNMEFKFHDKWGGHVISFLNLEKPDEILKSAQFAVVAVEELTLCASRSILDLFIGCLRWPGIDRPLFMASTNPDGPGHSWVKRLWVTRDYTSSDDRSLDPSAFHFVRSLPSDNPHLGDAYIAKLAMLPPYLREPWLNGSWDILAGQRFSQFRHFVHVVKPFRLEDFGPVSYFRSIDYGTVDPYACGWYGVLNNLDTRRMEVYKVKEDTATGIKARVQAQRILAETDAGYGQGWPMKIVAPSYLDTQCWAEEDDGLTIASKYEREGVPVVKVLKDRATGWEALDDLLHWEHTDESFDEVKVPPVLRFFSTCSTTIQQITDAMWDSKKGNDILTPRGEGMGHWDSLDETRYFALTHMKAPKAGREDSRMEYHERVWRAMTRTGRRLRQ